MHIEEDIACGLPSLPDVFLSYITDQRVVICLPAVISYGVHITNVVSYSERKQLKEVPGTLQYHLIATTFWFEYKQTNKNNNNKQTNKHTSSCSSAQVTDNADQPVSLDIIKIIRVCNKTLLATVLNEEID